MHNLVRRCECVNALRMARRPNLNWPKFPAYRHLEFLHQFLVTSYVPKHFGYILYFLFDNDAPHAQLAHGTCVVALALAPPPALSPPRKPRHYLEDEEVEEAHRISRESCEVYGMQLHNA